MWTSLINISLVWYDKIGIWMNKQKIEIKINVNGEIRGPNEQLITILNEKELEIAKECFTKLK